MEFELALRTGKETAHVLPLRLSFKQGSDMLLDHEGKLDSFLNDWELAHHHAGIYGRIVHWYTREQRQATYGFEVILLDAERQATGTTWITYPQLGVPVISIHDRLETDKVKLLTPLCGAEYTRGQCNNEIKNIQELLVEYHPSEIEDEIKNHAPWLRAEGTSMSTGTLEIGGEDSNKTGVVFNYPDNSQMGITERQVIIPPMTFSPDMSARTLWNAHAVGRA